MRLLSPKRNDTTLSQFIVKRPTTSVPLKIFLSGHLVLLLVSAFFKKAVLFQDVYLITHHSKLMTFCIAVEFFMSGF